ncbi:single-pass membrane and coiled-coil domain-containing protein 1 [Crotalus adamanteus]|uniref:Single-pass membrane and coiled-coil domain-containing protein 1 n=1 Tax=Crotalus adamanteus TaxID=8729 RepID=A0AAW1BG45_CROAD
MAKESLSLCVLNKTLNRIENKLQTIKSQYIVLDSGIQKLSEKFDFWNTVLEQDVMWTSLLEDRFNSVEINLFYSYICETIQCLHSQVRTAIEVSDTISRRTTRLFLLYVTLFIALEVEIEGAQENWGVVNLRLRSRTSWVEVLNGC